MAGLSSRLQTHAQSQMQNLQRPTTSRNSYHSITGLSNSLVKAMEHQTNYRGVEGADSNGEHTSLCGSGGSDKQVHTTSDCRGQYGASVHQGINRGTVNKDLQIALFINDFSRHKMVKFKLYMKWTAECFLIPVLLSLRPFVSCGELICFLSSQVNRSADEDP